MVVNIKSFIFHLIHLNIFNASLYFKILIFTMSKVHLLYYFNKMKNFRCLIMLEIFPPQIFYVLYKQKCLKILLLEKHKQIYQATCARIFTVTVHQNG